MANPVLDQFTYALFFKVVPMAIFCGIAGTLLRVLLKGFERRANRFAAKLAAFKHSDESEDSVQTYYVGGPHCPSCNRTMVKRTARRGSRAGSEFWGCSNYPVCRGTRALR